MNLLKITIIMLLSISFHCNCQFKSKEDINSFYNNLFSKQNINIDTMINNNLLLLIPKLKDASLAYSKVLGSEYSNQIIKEDFKDTYLILYNREYYSCNRGYEFLLNVLSNQTKEELLQFDYVRIDTIYYLICCRRQKIENKYNLNLCPFICIDSSFNKTYTQVTYDMTNKIINDPKVLINHIQKAENYPEFRLLQDSYKSINKADLFIRTLDNRKYEIISDEYFEINNDNLKNHSLILQIGNLGTLKLNFVFIDNKWLLESIYY